jgi:hypothetical protein
MLLSSSKSFWCSSLYFSAWIPSWKCFWEAKQNNHATQKRSENGFIGGCRVNQSKKKYTNETTTMNNRVKAHRGNIMESLFKIPTILFFLHERFFYGKSLEFTFSPSTECKQFSCLKWGVISIIEGLHLQIWECQIYLTDLICQTDRQTTF